MSQWDYVWHNCGGILTLLHDRIQLYIPEEPEYSLCCMSCLSEFAWKKRDAVPKLSKSKQSVEKE